MSQEMILSQSFVKFQLVQEIIILDQELAGGNLCFVCQKVPWYFLKGEYFYFMKTHFLQISDGA